MGVMTAIAIGGLAISAAGATKSFIDAGKQRKAQTEAQNAANAAMAEARKKLDVNFYDKLSVNKEPYELAREAMLVQGAEAIQAGVESERGAAATAGKVQMAQNEGQASIRTEMGNELTNIQNKQVDEQSRLRDINFQLDTEEAAGAQQAAADAQKAAVAANAQGWQGVQSTAQQALAMAPLYGGGGKTADPFAQPNAGKVATGAANTTGGPTNYVMQEQQNKPYDPSKWWTPNAAPTAPKYDPYQSNPFLFYKNPGLGGS